MRALREGPLGRAGGVAVLDSLPDSLTMQALADEAQREYASSTRQELVVGDGEPGRGGTPARALRSVGGSTAQDAFYASPALHAFLSAYCGCPIVPSGNRGSYSYYVAPGDHLDIHLDVETCDVTLISVLHDDTDPGEPAGGLVAYPRALGESLDRVRAAPGVGAALIKARPGQSILILGGLVPHRVEPIRARGQRVISALCFRAV